MKLRELFDLSGKVAIITGGGRGIGLKMAEGLAEMGASVVLCSRKMENCQRAVEKLGREGFKALALVCNVSSSSEIQKVVDTVMEKFGRLDILVNNSGITWGAPVEEYPIQGWQKVMDINLTGVFLFTQIAGRVMIKQKSGNIINIASIMGISGMETDAAEAIGYSVSKGGVIIFTKDLAAKWARFNIRVNALAPGWFPSDMTEWILGHQGKKLLKHIPMGRFGDGDELKGAVVFLASEASSYVTGTIIPIDGGYLSI